MDLKAAILLRSIRELRSQERPLSPQIIDRQADPQLREHMSRSRNHTGAWEREDCNGKIRTSQVLFKKSHENSKRAGGNKNKNTRGSNPDVLQ